MAITRIKALVNMPCTGVRLENREGAYPVLSVGVYAAVSCRNWAVPWCSSPTDFENHRLLLTLTTPASTGSVRTYEYSIWQENFGGKDRIRFTSDGRYHRPDDPDPGLRSRTLASGRNGGEYVAAGETEAILVVDERPWVIMYKVGV